MAQVQKTTTVTIDEQSFEVSSLSENVQQMIALMDEWRQRDADLTGDLLMVRAAIRDIQNTLLSTIKAETTPAETTEVTEAAE